MTVLLPATTDCDADGAVCTGDGRMLSSGFSIVIPGPNSPATGAPTISGTAQVGQTLTADTSGIVDDDGLDDVSYSYQWIRNDGTTDADISTATSSTYTLVTDEEGKTIKVKVSFSDDADSEETLTSAATATVKAQNTPATGAVKFIVRSRIRGGEVTVQFAWNGNKVLQLGEFHTIHLMAIGSGVSDEDGLTSPTFSYQWLDDGIDMQYAVGNVYTLSDLDVGKTINVKASFTDDAGNNETLTSTQSVTVQAHTNTHAEGLPTISGAARVGETLTVATTGISDEDGLTSPKFSYQWISDDTDIDGATGSDYLVSPSDEGHTIKARVSFVDDMGYTETLTSSATASVTASGPGSYISVSVTRDDTDPSNIVDYLTVTWNDADDCSSDYNTYLVATSSSGDTTTHLGSASSDGTQIAKALARAQGRVAGYEVRLYCGTDVAGRRVSAVAIPSQDTSGPRPGTYSSELPLTGLSTSHGTLTPAFNPNWRKYAVPDVASENSRTTIFATTKSGYAVDFYEGTDGPVLAFVVQAGSSCSEVLLAQADDIVPDALTDADLNTAGFQVDLNKGKNYILARVSVSTDNCDVGTLYRLDVTREGTPNQPATGLPAISGTPRVGQTLTASTSGITDADGLSNATFMYQWIADDTDIVGAKSATYEVASGDVGKTIKVHVSFTDDAGNKESATSAATSAVTSLLFRSNKYQLQSSSSEESSSISYISVSVIQDISIPHNVVTDFRINWNDVEDCSSDYNSYLLVSLPSGDTTTLLGSTGSDGTEITNELSGVRGNETGFDVELYCGTDASGRLVSRVAIPSDDDGNPNPGTYSSEPPLTGLSVSHGTLTPAFNSHTMRYKVPNVGSTVQQMTITAPARSGYIVGFHEGTNGFALGSLLVTYPGGVPVCGDIGFGSESGDIWTI